MGDVAKRRRDELELIKDVASRCKTAVVTGPAAARWLGLSTYRWVQTVDLALPDNSRTWGDTDRHRVYHGGLLRDAEYLTHNGVRTATAIRAMFDTFRYHGRMDALVQIESARFQHDHLTTDYLLAKTETLTRARGIKPFRELIAYSADTSASALETIARDTLLRALESGRLTGVETIEFQVGFQITDADGWATVAWADALINGFLIVEADGLEKNSGAMGDAAEALRRERHRETELQNRGAVVRRVGWTSVQEDAFIAQVQHAINQRPGVHQLPNRVDTPYRVWLADLERRAG